MTTLRIDMSDALYRELEGGSYDAKAGSKHPGRAALAAQLGLAERRQRKRGGGRVRTTWRMDLSADVQAWLVSSALPNAISSLTDHGTSGSPQEAGHVAGALKAARNLLAKLGGKKTEYSDAKTPTPDELVESGKKARQDELARPQKEAKERSKANAPTKQRRRQEAVQEAANGKDRIGVPRMQTLLDADGGSLLVSARPAGSEDGLVQYYVRISKVKGHRLVRERLVSGVAGYQRLAKGIARGHDSSAGRIATNLGTKLQEEGMEL